MFSGGETLETGEVIFTLGSEVPAAGERAFVEWSFDIVEEDGSQLDSVGPEFQMSVYLTAE